MYTTTRTNKMIRKTDPPLKPPPPPPPELSSTRLPTLKKANKISEIQQTKQQHSYITKTQITEQKKEKERRTKKKKERKKLIKWSLINYCRG